MDLLCIKDSRRGFIDKILGNMGHIPGITLGKVYEGTPVVTKYTKWFHQLESDFESIKFLIYNDDRMWAIYDPNLFKPITAVNAKEINYNGNA